MSQPMPLITAFFGCSNQLTEQQLQDDVLIPLLEEWGRIPDEIRVPAEGATSQWIDEWATTMHIPVHVFQADWVQHGRRAQMIREAGMRKGATCAVVFLSTRSDRLEKYAETMARRDGKQVITISTSSSNQMPPSVTMTELCVQQLPPPQASVRARKSGKGKEQT